MQYHGDKLLQPGRWVGWFKKHNAIVSTLKGWRARIVWNNDTDVPSKSFLVTQSPGYFDVCWVCLPKADKMNTFLTQCSSSKLQTAIAVGK